MFAGRNPAASYLAAGILIERKESSQYEAGPLNSKCAP